MSSANISPTTGESWYSGSAQEISGVLRVLDIGEGRMAVLTEALIAQYQERVDRQIDSLLSELYITPLRAMNQIQPNGVTKRVFPGDVKHCALYWVAGEILLNEFQQLAQNITDQAQAYVDNAKKQAFAMRRFNHRMLGQERKSHVSRTMPPGLQPASFPEADF